MGNHVSSDLARFSKTLFGRLAGAPTFFDGQLLEDLLGHFGLDRSSITMYDEDAVYRGLYMLDFDQDAQMMKSLFMDEHQYKYTYKRNPVYQAINRYYRQPHAADAPVFRSAQIIAPAEYDQNEHIRYLGQIFGGTYYNAVMPFGEKGQFRLSFHKSRMDGDFTDRELDLLEALTQMLSAGYDSFCRMNELHDELRLKAYILDTNRIGLMVLNERLDTVECNRHMQAYLPEITRTDSLSHAKEVLLEGLSALPSGGEGAEVLVKKHHPNFTVCIGAYPCRQDRGCRRVYYYVSVLPDQCHSPNSPALRMLSPREKELAELLLKGASYQQIAQQLFISLSTVRNHVQNIYKKLGINSQRQLLSLYLGIQ